MIASFFHSLSDHGVEYLLISGQATVLYGAATFSEDIDLWINPTPANGDRFAAALRRCHARFYKLTPPLTAENLGRGHGFHFVLPGGEDSDVYLDAMGRPPRVESFGASLATARWMDSRNESLQLLFILSVSTLMRRAAASAAVRRALASNRSPANHSRRVASLRGQISGTRSSLSLPIGMEHDRIFPRNLIL